MCLLWKSEEQQRFGGCSKSSISSGRNLYARYQGWNELFEYSRIIEYCWTDRIFSVVRIVGGNACLIFQRFLPKLCTVAHCPAPVGHPIAIDEMTRIDQHNLAAHITCLSFWKQRCFYFFDLPKKRSDDPSRSMAFRLRRCLELFPRTPLHRLASVANSDYKLRFHLKLNFPCFTLQVWWFQG